jgi:lycopene cyclase CruP
MASSTTVPPVSPVSDRVRNFLERIPGGTSLRALESADRAWSTVRSDAFTTPPATPAVVVHQNKLLAPGSAPDYDAVICGGTLGIFVGAALARRGWRVAVVEQVPKTPR